MCHDIYLLYYGIQHYIVWYSFGHLLHFVNFGGCRAMPASCGARYAA